MATTKKEKVLSCFGFVNAASAAKMCKTTSGYVRNVWCNYDFQFRKIANIHRKKDIYC
ncbi:hypothetical protein [Polaribacter atrinae]|uniref:hypothetical protein n=1 Tax=Polaribacter atrinae TaxID=1333662 RepID=UPI0030F70DD3